MNLQTVRLTCVRPNPHRNLTDYVFSEEKGVDVVETDIPLLYDGPRDPEELYRQRFVDRRPCGVQRARVMRVRARFNVWSLRFTLMVDPQVIGPDRVRKALDGAGQKVGLLDHRPRYGRFEVEKFEVQP